MGKNSRNTTKGARAYPAEKGLKGTVIVPGDKSISHRAILMGAIAHGLTEVTGLLEGEDVLRSATAMRVLGADIERHDGAGESLWTIVGEGGRLHNSEKIQGLYFGNAGTGVRLAMGLVAGCGIAASFDGDASLRARPMGRIVDPLMKMGAVASANAGRLPVQFEGSQRLKAIRYRLPVPSAQIKSAILLAGLNAKGTTIIEEPVRSRDHTENMLKAFGVDLSIADDEIGRTISLVGEQKLEGMRINVPGDPSSAAFIIAAALIVPDSDITLTNIMMNPMRVGLFTTLQEMGANLEITNRKEEGGEPVADIRVRSSELQGVEVPKERAPSMIDEYPVLCIIAAFAKGTTLMQGIGEMRIKESDRIAACQAGLLANGVEVETGEDWMQVKGAAARTQLGGGNVITAHDHRIAMSFLIMGLACEKPIKIDDISMIATSFPGFTDLLQGLGANIMVA